VLPAPRIIRTWTEAWVPHEQRLHDLQAALRDAGAVVISGGEFDRWDCEVRGGVLGATRVRLLVEEHGRGRQLARYRVWPRAVPRGIVLLALLLVFASLAAADRAAGVAAVFAAMAALAAFRMLYECGASMAAVTGLFEDTAAAPRATAPEIGRTGTPARIVSDGAGIGDGDAGPDVVDEEEAGWAVGGP
jgi:hypothetical protein